MMNTNLSLLLGFGILAATLGLPVVAEPCCCCASRDRDFRQAMDLAEAETGGEAVHARRVELGGTHTRGGLPGGMEVLVRMPEADRGWRCLIDLEVMKLRRKVAIPNPPRPRRRVSPGRTS